MTLVDHRWGEHACRHVEETVLVEQRGHSIGNHPVESDQDALPVQHDSKQARPQERSRVDLVDVGVAAAGISVVGHRYRHSMRRRHVLRRSGGRVMYLIPASC